MENGIQLLNRDGHSISHNSKRHYHDAFVCMNRMRQRGLLCDIVLHVATKEIKAHKVVLASCSPYFHAMFTSKYLGLGGRTLLLLVDKFPPTSNRNSAANSFGWGQPETSAVLQLYLHLFNLSRFIAHLFSKDWGGAVAQWLKRWDCWLESHQPRFKTRAIHDGVNSCLRLSS